MAFCEYCGNKLIEGAAFCEKCGTRAEADSIYEIRTKHESVHCSNCGNELRDGAEFCDKCGTAVKNDEGTKEVHPRKQEFVGTIKKCPSCGAEISGMTAICPTCEYEIVSSDNDHFLDFYIQKMDDVEQTVLEDERRKQNLSSCKASGWKSWGKRAKVAWIILNVFTLCLPLILYCLFKYLLSTRLSPGEKQKEVLIENFSVPNERRAIIEAMNYIGGKINALSTQKGAVRRWLWIKLWKAKADQVFQKANLLIPTIVNVDSYGESVSIGILLAKKTAEYVDDLENDLKNFVINGDILELHLDFKDPESSYSTIRSTTIENTGAVYHSYDHTT